MHVVDNPRSECVEPCNQLHYRKEITWNVNYERYLTQTGVVKPLKHVRNSDVNGLDQVSAINQVRTHFCQMWLKVLNRFIF